jgi:nitronate monooxygenase
MSVELPQISPMDRTLMDRLRLRVPLVQAPMAGVSTPELAAAVTNAGGLGSVALGALSAAAAEQTLARTRELTGGPIAANVFVHDTPLRSPAVEAAFLSALAPLFESAGARPPDRLEEIYVSFNDNDEMLEVLLRARPEVVSLHFGTGTADRIDALRGAGMLLMATATTLAEARELARSGIDVIVLQHSDAGGHSGAFLGDPADAGSELATLVAAMRTELELPVVAAGGLMDGGDIGAVLAAGAAAAQLGTAFVACPETLASDTYRDRLRGRRATRTTARISGRSARGIENPLMQALDGLDVEVPDYPLTYDAIKQLVAAVNEPAFSVMWAGAGAARARPMPAAELVGRLEDELAAYWADQGTG